jgi:hypothetical protein
MTFHVEAALNPARKGEKIKFSHRRQEIQAKLDQLVSEGQLRLQHNNAMSVTSGGPTVSDRESAAIQQKGKTWGCHTCGSKVPNNSVNPGVWIGDHQAPTQLIESGILPKQAQRLYPQCDPDSRRQGGLISALLKEWRNS